MTSETMAPDSALLDLSASSEVVVAGWTGRDREKVLHHVDELAALGVAPPSRTPLFYRVAPDRLSQADVVSVVGSETSGEAEPVLVWRHDGIYVGIGSDHTDRASERVGIAISKQLCPKVVGRRFWRLDSVLDHWDSLIIRAVRETDRVETLYQNGPLSILIGPEELIALCRESNSGRLAEGSVMFCGTVPTIGGILRADFFTVELHDPVKGATIRHRYEICELPVIE